MITQEHEYYLRFILLLIQGGTELLREIAAKALQKCNTPLNSFLSKNASVIQHTKDLSKKQKDILYPSSPTVVSNIKEFDITLLSYLITNFLTGNLDSNEKNAVEKIKEMRNVYHAHTNEAKMTAKTYTKEWNKLMRIICTVSQNLPEEKRNSLSETIESIENEQLDIKVVIDEIKQLDQTNDFFEYIKKSLDELNQNMDARFSKIEKDLLELKLKMENQGKKTKVVNTVRGQVTLSADEQETVDYAAEKLLLEASKDCIENSPTEHNKQLREKVGNLVEDIEKLDIKVENVSEGSIVFEFKCFSLSALIDLIDYFNSAKFKARLREIAEVLEKITGKKIYISGSLDIQSFQDVITKMQVKRYEKVVNFEMECTGVDGLLHAIEIFEGGKAENTLNELSTALTESVGKPVTLHTSINIEQMQRAIDSIREELDDSESEETSINPSEQDTVMTMTDTVADAVGDASFHENSVASLKPSSDFAVNLNSECTDGKTSQAALKSDGTSVKKKVTRQRMKQPPLIKQLKGILSEYPDGGQILKELIQNAEDAGALEVKFMFEKKRTSYDIAPNMYSRFFKGPALYVYNDAVFTEQDWEGIQMIYSSVKEDDPLKVGKFGLGFKSVFHITDFPCVLSGNKLLLIDPQQDEVNPEDVNSTFELKSLDDYDEVGFDPNTFWKALDKMVGFQKESLLRNGIQGTIFWFPLREKASSLSETIYNEDKVMDLFDALRSEASSVLLFLRNIEKISLHVRREDGSVKESMRVEITDSDNKVRNARRLFKERISSLSPGYNDEDIHNSTPMRINTVFDGIEESNTWLVVNYFVGKSASNKFRALIKDTNLGFSPYVGVAAPLFDKNDALEGNVFCFLPLPREGESMTGLPVHVNGFFALSQNRHHMKWETEEQHGKKIDDKSILWNMALLEEALPRAYEILVSEAVKISNKLTNTKSSVKCVYNMFPVGKENEERKSHRRWMLLEQELYKRLKGKNILYCEHLDRWISPEEASFATLRSVTSAKGETDETLKHAVVKCLQNIGLSYVDVSVRIFETLQTHFRNIQDLTPELLAKYLRSNTGYQTLNNSEKLEVLKYFVHNKRFVENLKDLELLPLASGGWTKFGKEHEDVFLCSDEAVGMFPGLEQDIVMKSAELGDTLAEWMKKVRKSGTFQIKRIDPANAKKLFKKTLEKHVGSSTKVTLSKHTSLTFEWLKHTWDVLGKNGEFIKEISEIPLIPVLDGGTWEDPVAMKLSRMSDLKILKAFPGRTISEDICSCLEVMSVTIIPSLPSWIPGDIIKQFVHMPDESGVLGVLRKIAKQNCEKAITDFNRSCDEQKAEAMIDLLKDLNMDTDLIKLISGLDIFKCMRTMHGEYRLSSVHRNPRYMIKVPDFPPEVQFVSECIIITEKEEQFLKKLGGEKVTLDKLVSEILQTIQHMTRHNELEKLMSYVLTNFYLFEQRQDIRNLASDLAFVKAGPSMRKPSELYDPTDSFLQDLLLDECLFPDNSDSLRMPALRALGLKEKRDLDSNVMLCVAESLHQLSKESNNDEKICKKAKAFKEVLEERPELLQGKCSKSGKELFVSIRDLCCILVRKERISDYPDRLDWFAESMLLCSPAVAKTCDFGLIVGATVPVVECSSPKLASIFHWNENPKMETVIQQLGYCRKYFQKQDKCDFEFCAYVHKLYKHMSSRIEEIRNLRGKLKNKIFVWTGDSFEIPTKVIINLQEKVLDVRPYFYSIPDQFLDMASLFQHIGCKACIDSSILITVLNQIKENNKLQDEIPQTVSRHVQIVVQVLKELSAENQKEGDVNKDDILMLTNEGSGRVNLRPVSLCIFEDDEDEIDHDEKGKVYIVHEKVPHDVALNLGVRSLERKTIHDASEDLDFEEWGQSEPLTTRISSLLREGYKDGLSVPKELVQNADDAGATVVKFLYDERRNLDAMEKLFTTELSECQGPALWVYNDSVFTENDLENIIKLNGGTKANSDDKIGKFGLGFCSVYNLTDVPSFVSGNNMIIFDPHESYIEGIRKKRGRGLRINLSKHLIRRNIDQFKPFSNVFDNTFTDTDFTSFNATLFRLPLRTGKQAKRSKISEEEYSKAKVIELLNKFEENAGNILLFSQNVKAIELYHLDNSETDPRKAKLIFELRKTATTMAGEETTNVLRRIPAILKSGLQFEELHTVNISLNINDGSLLEKQDVTKAEFKSSWIISWALGRKASQDLAKSLTGKGAVPLSSVAVPIINATPIDLDKVGNGFYKEGHIFCFLPLPIETGLPFHINGCFSVRSDRTGLVSFTEDDIKKDKVSKWNPILMQDSLVSSFVQLLQYLAAHSSPDYDYHLLWPLKVKVDVKPFQDSFRRSIFMEKQKLFRGQQDWLSVDEIFFLDPIIRSSAIGNTAFELLSKVPVRPGKQIVEMPPQVLDFLKTCKFDAENILKLATVSEEEVLVHFLETINDKMWEDRADERNKVVLYALSSSNDSVLSKVEVTRCIPSQPNGVLCIPSELIDPRSDIAKMFDIDEGFFPLQQSKFNEEKSIDKLVELGMLNRTVPHKILLARCVTVPTLESQCSRCALERSLNVLKYVGQWNHIDSIEKDKATLTELRNIQFVPVKPCPKTWKFTWGADRLQVKSVNTACKSHSLPSGSSNIIKFDRPNALYRESSYSCLGSVCAFIFESLIKKNCCPAEKMYSVLAVKSEMKVELLVNQLELLSEQYTNEETQYTNLEKIIREVYDNIARLVQNEPEKEICNMPCFSNKKKLRIVLKGKSLVAPEHVAFNVKSECSFGMFRLEVPDYNKRKVFKAFGVSEYFSVEYMITLFREMKNKWSNNKCSDIESVTKLISNLCECMSREQKNFTDIEGFCETVVAPDTKGYLRPTYELVIEDPAYEEFAFHILHGSVPPDEGKLLGVKSKQRKLVEGFSSKIFIPFGQNESLVTRLTGILEDYPCDSSIMKELIQNADDAGATELHFIKNYGTHSSRKLFGKPELQGPSLCIFNDSFFSDEDFEGIRHLGIGSKREDPSKTGQYGIGFNAVYHLTDVPSFLTKGPNLGKRGQLCIFDPLMKYLDEEFVSKDNPGIRCDVEQMAQSFPEMLHGYPNAEKFDKGTIFRLPLRQKCSPISKTVMSVDQIDQLIDNFKKDMFECLLFLKCLKCIKIMRINGDTLQEEYSVHASLSDEESVKRDKYFRDFKNIVQVNRDERQLNLTVSAIETSYMMNIEDTKKTSQCWRITNRFGVDRLESKYTVLKDALEQKELGLLPIAAVAVSLPQRNIKGKDEFEHGHYNCQNGRAFCFLPLPIKTGMPLHINGHFALDKARSKLWDEGVRKTWNEFIMSEVVCRCWISAVNFLKLRLVENEIESVKSPISLDMLLKIYHDCFPQVKNATDSFSKVLVSGFYRIVVHENINIFPCIKKQNACSGNSDQRSQIYTVEWVHLSRSDNDFSGFFNSIYKSEFSQSGGKLQCFDHKTAKAVELILKNLGMKIIDTPNEIRNSVEESGIDYVPECTPNSVIAFLKSFRDSSANSCKLGTIDTSIADTRISSLEALRSLLMFLLTEKSLPEQIEGVPLCLTADAKLRTFEINRVTYCSSMSEVLIGSAEKFLHPGLVSMMNREQFIDSGILDHFTMQSLIDEIPATFNPGIFAVNNEILWNKNEGSPCPTSAIREIFLFIYDTSLDENGFVNQTEFKNNVWKLQNWSFLPSKTGSGQAATFQLMPICFSSHLLYQSHKYETVTKVLEKFNLPTLDSSPFYLRSTASSIFDEKERRLVSVLQKLLPSTNKPVELLSCLIHYVSRIRSLDCKEGLHILTYFNDHLEAMTTDESTTSSSLQSMLRQLPLYVSQQQELIDIVHRREVIVFPKGMPVDGIREWADHTGVVLLEEVQNLTQLFKFLNLSHKSELEVYIHHILPYMQVLPRQNWLTHLQYMKNNLLVTPLNGKLNQNQCILVEKLKSLAFITINGKDKQVRKLCDPENKVFACMLDGSCFLPSEFRKDEWYSFMELLGLIKKPTDKMMIAFASEIAKHANSPITDQIKLQSDALTDCLFNGQWDSNTLHAIKNVHFVVPFEVNSTRKAIFIQPGDGSMLIPLAGSISCQFEDLCWSTVNQLRKIPTTEMMKQLDISDKPITSKVVQHCQNICDVLKRKLEEKSVEVSFVKNLMETLYRFLADNFDASMKQNFQATPIVFLPEDEDMATVNRVVINATEEEEVKPFLYKLPTCLGTFHEFFLGIGADKSVRCAHYAVVLEDVWSKFKDESLPANTLEVVKKTIENLVRLLEKEDKSLDNVKTLYLPNEDRKLVPSTSLTVANNTDIKDRLRGHFDLIYFLGFRELDISTVPDPELPFLFVPDVLRPDILTNIIIEQVSFDDVQIEDSFEARRIESFIQCPQFVEGILRLVKHQMKISRQRFESQRERRIMNNLFSVEITKVTGLKTFLTYKDSRIDGTERQTVCFVKIENSKKDETKTKMFFQCDQSDNMFERLIEDKLGLTKVIDTCTEDILGKDMSRNVITILRCLEDPSKIRKKLDELVIDAYDFPHAYSMSVFPTPGTYVEEKFYPFLQHALVRFKKHEYRYVALEIEEDVEKMEETDGIKTDTDMSNSCDTELVYMYAHIIDEVPMQDNLPDLLTTYRVDVGLHSKEPVTVQIDRLYMFKPKVLNVVTPIEVCDVEPIGSVPIDENFRSVRQMLTEAWSVGVDEKSRRRVIRRLKMRWHPDRNKGHEEYAVRLFNYISEIVLGLERGDLISEETNEDTGRTAPNMSGSLYSETSSSALRRGKTYADNFYKHRNDYNSSTGSGRNANYESDEAVVRHVGEAKRWLKQAQQDLVAAKTNLLTAENDKSHNWVCYKCHQASEKALRAAWYSKNANNARIEDHSLSLLAKGLDDGSFLEKTNELEQIIGNYFKILYPDAFSGSKAIPSERFTEEQAKDSLKVTKKILKMSAEFITKMKY